MGGRTALTCSVNFFVQCQEAPAALLHHLDTAGPPIQATSPWCRGTNSHVFVHLRPCGSSLLIQGIKRAVCAFCPSLSQGWPQSTRLFSQHDVSEDLHAILAQTKVLTRHSRNSIGVEQYLLFTVSKGPALPFRLGKLSP